MDINKKIKIIEFKLSKLLNWWLFWAYKSKFHWNGMEFAEHREYIFWDSLKDIDWKTSWKTNHVYVKKYEEERDVKVLFLLDDSLSMKFWSQEITKKELLIEVFYSLALSAYFNNDNLWAFLFNYDKYEYIDYKKTKSNIFKILEKLKKEEYSNNFNLWNNSELNKLDKILEQLKKTNIKNNLIFILTDETERIDEKLLKIIWKENEIVFINIFDYLENNISDLSWNISLSLDNSFLNLDLSNRKKVDNYQKLRNKNLKYLSKMFRKNNIWYIKIDTNDDIFSKLMWYFYKIKM